MTVDDKYTVTGAQGSAISSTLLEETARTDSSNTMANGNVWQ
jgi:hypothetical protein